jgi:hypothetical protein
MTDLALLDAIDQADLVRRGEVVSAQRVDPMGAGVSLSSRLGGDCGWFRRGSLPSCSAEGGTAERHGALIGDQVHIAVG